MTNQPYETYLGEIQKNLSTGDATEHTHRPALQRLLESVDNGITVINEPWRRYLGQQRITAPYAGGPVARSRDYGDMARSTDAIESKEARL